MTPPDKRELMQRAGWSVHQRHSHVGMRWDFSAPGKGPMDSRIIETEAKAWAEAEAHFAEAVNRAQQLLAVVNPPGEALERLLKAADEAADFLGNDDDGMDWAQDLRKALAPFGRL